MRENTQSVWECDFLWSSMVANIHSYVDGTSPIERNIGLCLRLRWFLSTSFYTTSFYILSLHVIFLKNTLKLLEVTSASIWSYQVYDGRKMIPFIPEFKMLAGVVCRKRKLTVASRSLSHRTCRSWTGIPRCRNSSPRILRPRWICRKARRHPVPSRRPPLGGTLARKYIFRISIMDELYMVKNSWR